MKIIENFNDYEVLSTSNGYKYERWGKYYLKRPGVNEQYFSGREEVSNKDFLGVVLSYDEDKKEIVLEQRNYFKVGDEITIFGPGMDEINLKVEYIKNEKGDFIDVARHPKEIVRIPCDECVLSNSIIRVKF